MSDFRFDGKVAIVTGAGAGLGKAYVEYLAKHGAKVVVNDLGVSSSGTGSSAKVADLVVKEIKDNGGVAVPDYNSVEDGDKIVKTAIDAFGRIDILVNNAGFIRDKSFAKMTYEDWDKVLKVHLYGHFAVTHAAWKKMKEQNYGRIINISSGSGFFGNFGQANYCSAKAGIHGFTKTLAKEGASSNIKVNTLCPIASTRMTDGVMNAELREILKTDNVVPFMGVLAHERCPDSGQAYEIGGGWHSQFRWERSRGHVFDLPQFTAEAILDKWDSIVDFKNAEYPSETWNRFHEVKDLQTKWKADREKNSSGTPRPKL